MRFVFIVLCIAISALSCGSDEITTCVPGSTQECACQGGVSGVQVCNQQGSFDPCVCDASPQDVSSPADVVAADAGYDATDTAETQATDVPTSLPDAVEIVDEGPDTSPTQDLPITPEDIQSYLDLDSGAPDLSEPTQEPKYEVAGDCALPLDYMFLECADVVCPSGMACMGDGHCVPSGTFELPFGGNVSRSKIALAEGDGGRFAATWYENYTPPGQSTQEMDVFFALFEADGTPVSAPIKVDEDALPWARSPSMTRLLGGGFLVVWRAQIGFSGEIRYMARALDPDGQPAAPAFQLNDTELTKETAGATNVDSPFTKLLRSFSVAVTWMGQMPSAPPASLEEGEEPAYTDAFLRVLSQEGAIVNGEMDTGGAQFGVQESSPVVTDTLQGGVAIFWHNRIPPPKVPKDPTTPPDGAPVNTGAIENHIKGRVFDQAAMPLGDPQQISQDTIAFEGMPCATTFDDGAFFVTWRTSDTDGSTTATDIRGQLLDGSGAPLGEEQHFGLDPKGYYPFYAPTGAPDDDRAFIVWHTIQPGLDGIYLRRYYRAEDIMDCEETHVSGPKGSGESGSRRLPAILTFDDGRTLIGWQSSFSGSSKLMLRYMK